MADGRVTATQCPPNPGVARVGHATKQLVNLCLDCDSQKVKGFPMVWIRRIQKADRECTLSESIGGCALASPAFRQVGNMLFDNFRVCLWT